MEIIGQFNSGFIVTKLDNDLFLVDQHAADEKYNFEQLMKNTVIRNQKMVQPMSMDLSLSDELIVESHLNVFKKNGFELSFDLEQKPTKRVKLLSLPMSKSTVFSVDDVLEMISILRQFPNTMCRPSKVIAMFAMRSCRMSVMFGKALNKKEMTRIVHHLGQLKHPWTCPHGRPTMRHLLRLEDSTLEGQSKNSERKRKFNNNNEH
eukprot:Anaeramoba_flamelloidesa815961_30.p1 GENE.a815961_30~~a815961_30.p1  ORF type:complete len:206 (-),score=33.33 a815961_30:217-834(-)